jgi:hypothetical protein
MERLVLLPLDQANFRGRGEENCPVTGHYLVSSYSAATGGTVKIDQITKINSVSGLSRAARNRADLLSMVVCRQLPEDTDFAKETDSRPCLAVLPGGAQSDVELMRCFRAGDWDGFAALYDRYFSTAYLICRRRLTCSETALDSANDTFLAMIAESDYLDPYRLGDWLMDTAHYLADRRAQHTQPSSNRFRMQLIRCYVDNDSGTGELT